MASYLEALADAQVVGESSSVVFAVTDIVGPDFTFSPPGSQIFINTPGVYLVDWSVNLSSAPDGAIFGIVENGERASALSHSGTSGNLASGSLIVVDTVPFAVSLENYFTDVEIDNVGPFGNTAASIRIIRLADGPTP